jgi:hypothetical protein
MDEKEIISSLNRIGDILDNAQSYIDKNEWDNLKLGLSQVDIIQAGIKTNHPSVDTLLAENSSFKSQFEPLKESVLAKSARVISSIEEWKQKNLEKITDSKNTLDNISKYYKPSQNSYYIDTKE